MVTQPAKVACKEATTYMYACGQIHWKKYKRTPWLYCMQEWLESAGSRYMQKARLGAETETGVQQQATNRRSVGVGIHTVYRQVEAKYRLQQ